MKSLVQLSLATLLLSTKVPSSAQLSNLLLMSLGAEEDEGEAERRRRERKLALLESVAAKLISSARTTPPPPPTPPTPPPALLPSANPSPMKLDLAGKELQEEEQEIQFDESAATATQSRTDKLPQASTSTSSRRITAASATTRNTVNSSFKSPLILASSSTSTLAHSASRRKLSATAPYPHLLIKLNSSTMASPLVTRRSTPLTQVNNSASSISCTTVKKSKIKFISPVFITSTTPCAQRRSTASITSKLHLEESSLQLTNIKTEINRMETLNRKMKLLQTHLKNNEFVKVDQLIEKWKQASRDALENIRHQIGIVEIPETVTKSKSFRSSFYDDHHGNNNNHNQNNSMRNKKRSVQQEQLQYYEPQTGWMSKRGKALYLRLQQALEAGGSAAITHTEESEMEEEGEEEEEDQEMNLIEDDEVEEENVQTARVNEESVDPFQESHSSTSLNRGGGGGGNQLRCLLLNELASRLGFPISMLGQYDEEGDVFM